MRRASVGLFLFSMLQALALFTFDQAWSEEPVVWYEPEISQGSTKDVRRVYISGLARSKSKVFVKTENVIVVRSSVKAARSLQLPISLVEFQKALGTKWDDIYRVTKKCQVFQSAMTSSLVVGTIKRKRKVRARAVNDQWYLLSRQKGKGFVDASCLKLYKSSSRRLGSQVSRKGEFAFHLELPVGLNQVPVEFRERGKKSQTLLLAFNVEEDKVSVNTPVVKRPKSSVVAKSKKVNKPKGPSKVAEPTPSKTASTTSSSRMEVSLGLGANLSTLDQSLKVQKDVNFSNLEVPTLQVGFTYYRPSWNLRFQGQQASGEIKDSVESFQLIKGSYDFRNLTLIYWDQEGASYLVRSSFDWSWGAGVALRGFPILLVKPSLKVEATQVQSLGLVVGGAIFLPFGDPWQFSAEGLLGYGLQSSTDEGELTSSQGPLSLDVDLSVSYSFSANWYALGSWSLQWQSFEFAWKKSSESLDLEGDLSILNSRVLISTGFLF